MSEFFSVFIFPATKELNCNKIASASTALQESFQSPSFISTKWRVCNCRLDNIIFNYSSCSTKTLHFLGRTKNYSHVNYSSFVMLTEVINGIQSGNVAVYWCIISTKRYSKFAIDRGVFLSASLVKEWMKMSHFFVSVPKCTLK